MGRAPIKQLPPAEWLHELLHYDPETGVLTWKRQAGTSQSVFGFNNKCGGKVAGTVPKNSRSPYRMVSFLYDGQQLFLLAHRIIWKMMTGEDPPSQIDHIDGNRNNNAWRNLRSATNGQNMTNSAPRSRSGFKGVYHCGLHQKWRAVVSHGGRINHVGYFSTPELAAEARHREAQRLQGQFARTY